jgi:hypothetical protein
MAPKKSALKSANATAKAADKQLAEQIEQIGASNGRGGL